MPSLATLLGSSGVGSGSSTTASGVDWWRAPPSEPEQLARARPNPAVIQHTRRWQAIIDVLPAKPGLLHVGGLVVLRVACRLERAQIGEQAGLLRRGHAPHVLLALEQVGPLAVFGDRPV